MEQIKKYLNRNPKVGDMVEATSNPLGFGDHCIGYEYNVLNLRNGYIVVTGERVPSRRSEIIIPDGQYSVFEMVNEVLPKEIHVKEYRLFGVKLLTRKTLVFDGNLQ